MLDVALLTFGCLVWRRHLRAVRLCLREYCGHHRRQPPEGKRHVAKVIMTAMTVIRHHEQWKITEPRRRAHRGQGCMIMHHE